MIHLTLVVFSLSTKSLQTVHSALGVLSCYLLLLRLAQAPTQLHSFSWTEFGCYSWAPLFTSLISWARVEKLNKVAKQNWLFKTGSNYVLSGLSLTWTCFCFFQCNFGIPQNWLIWVWLPPEFLQSSFLSIYHFSSLKYLENTCQYFIPVLCAVPGFQVSAFSNVTSKRITTTPNIPERIVLQRCWI